MLKQTARPPGQSPIRVNIALKATPGNCSALPSKSTMSPFSVPFNVSVDHVGPEQRLEAGVGIVTQGRDLDVNLFAFAGVVADKGIAGIAAAEFAGGGVEYAIAGAMDGMKFNLV